MPILQEESMVKKAAQDKAVSAKPAKSKEPAKGKQPAPGKKQNALQQQLTPSKELGAVIGDGAVTRGEVVSKVWQYIKSEKLQNPKDGREIQPDDKLKKVFKKDKLSMFEMSKILAQHLK